MKQRIQLIYILAASHSGSTLLAMLLGTHPEICTIGELKFTSLGNVDRYLCSCQKEIKKCSFWSDVVQEMAKRGYPFDFSNAGTDFHSGMSGYVRRLLRPLHRGRVLEWARDSALAFSPTWRTRFPQVQKLNSVLIESIYNLTGKRVIVDSSKVGLRLKFLLRNPTLDVKVIRLIRDGRAVAMTYTDPAGFADAFDPDLRGGGMGGERESERLTMVRAAREWKRSNEEAEAALRNLDSSQWVEVQYETLCSETAGTLKKIFEFIGVNSDYKLPSFRSVDHHIIGNGMRLDSGDEIKLDERWRESLTESELEAFNLVAGELNRRFGYT
jgi:hypothetical protein